MKRSTAMTPRYESAVTEPGISLETSETPTNGEGLGLAICWIGLAVQALHFLGDTHIVDHQADRSGMPSALRHLELIEGDPPILTRGGIPSKIRRSEKGSPPRAGPSGELWQRRGGGRRRVARLRRPFPDGRPASPPLLAPPATRPGFPLAPRQPARIDALIRLPQITERRHLEALRRRPRLSRL